MRARQHAARAAGVQAVDERLVGAAQHADRQFAERREMVLHALLDREHVAQFDEPRDRVRFDRDARALRDVVQHDRPFGCARNLFEVPADAGLVRADVGRRRDQIARAVPALPVRDLAQHGARVRTADADHDRRARADDLEERADDRLALGVGQQRGLRRGAERDEAVDARALIVRGEVLQSVDVDDAAPERRDERQPETGEHAQHPSRSAARTRPSVASGSVASSVCSAKPRSLRARRQATRIVSSPVSTSTT